MNIKQLAFCNLLASWCQEGSCVVAASYAVIGKELGVTPVAAFLRTKTLEKYKWIKRKEGRLYLNPKFSKGPLDEWEVL